VSESLKMSQGDAVELLGAINEALTQTDPKIKFDLQVKLINTKAKLRPLVEAYFEMVEGAKVRGKDAMLQYCAKIVDEDGKETPKLSPDGKNYLGLARGQSPEYDAVMTELNASLKAESKKEIEVAPCWLKESDLPHTVTGMVTEQLMRLVKQE